MCTISHGRFNSYDAFIGRIGPLLGYFDHMIIISTHFLPTPSVRGARLSVKDFQIRIRSTHQGSSEVVETVLNVRKSCTCSCLRIILLWMRRRRVASAGFKRIVVPSQYRVLFYASASQSVMNGTHSRASGSIPTKQCS